MLRRDCRGRVDVLNTRLCWASWSPVSKNLHGYPSLPKCPKTADSQKSNNVH